MTTLLDIMEKNNWIVRPPRSISSSDSARIKTAMNQPVVNVLWSFKAKRKHWLIHFDFYVGSELDVVLWQHPLDGRVKYTASILTPNFEQFIWIAGRYAMLPKLRLSPDDQTQIDEGLRAAYAKAITPVPFPVTKPLGPLTTSLDLV